MRIKNVCKYCGKAEIYTKKESIKKDILTFISMVLQILGVIFIIYVIFFVSINDIATSITTHHYYKANVKADDELRLITAEITKDCDGTNSVCNARKVFNELSTFRYIADSKYGNNLYEPLYVYENKFGDCKGLSNLYVAMLGSIGVDAKLDCNLNLGHCVAIVPIKEYGEYKNVNIVVDLTGPVGVAMHKTENNWDYINHYYDFDERVIWV